MGMWEDELRAARRYRQDYTAFKNAGLYGGAGVVSFVMPANGLLAVRSPVALATGTPVFSYNGRIFKSQAVAAGTLYILGWFERGRTVFTLSDCQLYLEKGIGRWQLIGGAFDNTTSISMDFTQQLYRSGTSVVKNLSNVPGFAFARNSVAYGQNADGTMVSFGVNVPRITNNGFLIEQNSTNLCLQSGNTADSSWSASGNESKTINQADPIGGTNAALITANGTSGTHQMSGPPNISYTSGTSYTFSMFVKAGLSTFVQMSTTANAFAATLYANFNLTTGVVTQSSGVVSSGVVSAGNGWLRLWFTAVANATAVAVGIIAGHLLTGTEIRNPTITTSGTFTVWGAQVEAISTLTSYIPTTTATATRAADAASYVFPSSLYNPAQFSITANIFYNSAQDGILLRPLAVSDGTTFANRIIFEKEQSNAPTINVIINGASIVSVGVAALTGPQTGKYGMSYDGSQYLASYKGVTPSGLPVVSAQKPPSLIRLDIGAGANGGFAWANGYIQKWQLYPTALNQAALNAVTT